MLREVCRAIAVAVLCLLSVSAWGTERFTDWLAKIHSFDGSVQSQKLGAHHWGSVAIDESYFKGDSIRTLDRSRARLQLPNETYWELNQNSRINLTDVNDSSSAKNIVMELLEGMALFRSRQSKSIDFRTPRLSGANNGTEFLVDASDDATIVTVYDGVIDTWNEHGKLSVVQGQSAIARKGQAPQLYLRVKPEDAVQWALYYPPVIDLHAVLPPGDGAVMKQALDNYRGGDLSGALVLLDQAAAPERGVEFHHLRAGLLLSVGRVEEAGDDIRQALTIDANDATALAQQAIVAVAKNQRDAGLALAQKAHAANPRSVPARLALSYAHQARFDLKAAAASAQQAAETEPGNGLALARLAELQLSLGEHRQAEQTVRKLLAVDPKSARANSLLGFVRLMKLDAEGALASFKEAVERDPSDPLGRFGLGLTQIRRGNLRHGTRELERAADLNPEDPMIRSYLGKAYYEQKRSGPAESEYRRATQLDPLDPTPYFYDAIKKQTENRPVEALHDMQQAIALNGNRQVYRSRQMLDSDVAARSAAQARIYNDLGFGQRALLDGWSSENTDPSNFSAHRLLADSYSNLQRHEIARVSEILQSQLLQPINITPIPPHLAETNVHLLSGLGPTAMSFNEFNPIFQRDRFALQTSGIVGSHNTYGDEVTHSGLIDKFSYSVGQYHYETDGFRRNNDLRHDIYNAFGQYAVSEDFSVQAEFRRQDTISGDQRMQFDPATFDPNRRHDQVRQSERFGAHWRISPSDDLIGSFIHSKSDDVVRTSEVGHEGFTDCELLAPDCIRVDSTISNRDRSRANSDTHSYELQEIHRAEDFNVIVGAGHYDQNRTDYSNYVSDKVFVSTPPLPDEFWELIGAPHGISKSVLLDVVSNTSNYTNAYLYSTAKLFNDIKFTAGVSGDFLHNPYRSETGGFKTRFDRNKVNPKLGIEWNVLPSTTIRAAWFKTLKRPFTSNQTVEPTNVAGFNQFYDDLTGSYMERYGAALDHRFNSSLFGGFEFSWRQIEYSSLRIDAPDPSRLLIGNKQFENSQRAYLYWTPLDTLALSAEYFRDDINSLGYGAARRGNIQSGRIPLQVRYFSPTGVFVKLGGTLNMQGVDSTFLPNSFGDHSVRSEDFWVFDASVGYRLPKRFGIVQAGVKNLFDQKFSYYNLDTNTGDPILSPYQPARFIYAQATISF